MCIRDRQQNIQIALQTKEIDIEDAIDVKEIKNLKLANQLLKLKRKKKQEQAQATAQQNIQAQAQANAQLAEKSAMAEVQKQQALTAEKVAIEQAKAGYEMQRMQAEAQIKKELMATEFQYNIQLAQAAGAATQQKEKEIEIKQLENEQQLMQFKNLDLQKDIDSKNRELGLSTMNLIKRNELLGTIKKELGSTKNMTDIEAVIKLINNNLNTSDDWKLFEEAFKNTDKGFMKKLKSEHSNLTSNDLRLCTY